MATQMIDINLDYLSARRLLLPSYDIATLVLVGCGGGGSTNVKPTLNFAARSDAELSQLISGNQISSPVGPDPQAHLSAVRAYADAGFDEVYIGQVGPEQEGFFEFYAREVLPRLRGG